MSLSKPVSESFGETLILSRMFSSACDVVIDGIDSSDVGPESGETLAQYSSAAADVLFQKERLQVKIAKNQTMDQKSYLTGTNILQLL